MSLTLNPASARNASSWVARRKMAAPGAEIRPARVLLIAPYAPRGGGMGRIMDYLATAGAPGVQFERIESRGGGHVAGSLLHVGIAAARIVGAAMSGRETIVHVNVAEGSSVLRKGLLLLVARLVGLRTVLHLHAADIIGFHARLPAGLRHLVAGMFRGADTCIVLGTLWRNWLEETLGVDPARIEIVRNGVPEPRLRMTRHAQAVPKLVFLGNLLPRKGLPDLLAALAQPELAATRWRLLVAGGGDCAPSHRAAHRLGLDGKVEFTGWLDRGATTRLLASADLLILPSYHEALPLVILEAFSLGIPVIATAVGALPEFVVDGQTARLVEPGNQAALARAIEDLLRNPDEAARIGAAGRVMFLKEFTITHFAGAMSRIYARHRRLPVAA